MWHFHNPVDLHAGVGSLAQLPQLLAGRPALLITFPEAAALGLQQKVADLLGPQLVGIDNSVLPNPDVSWLTGMHQRLWQRHAQVPCLIALGGGSVIDCAKAMLAPTPSGRFDELLAHLREDTPFEPDPAHLKSLIAIPTTAGTGSEVTPWATLWDAQGGRKYSLHRPWTWPQAAIIDASLMLSLPAPATLASGLDALSHALEAIWNVHRNPVSSTLASSAARAIVATLPALIREPEDLALREQMALAALQAGLAFSIPGLRWRTPCPMTSRCSAVSRTASPVRSRCRTSCAWRWGATEPSIPCCCRSSMPPVPSRPSRAWPACSNRWAYPPTRPTMACKTAGKRPCRQRCAGRADATSSPQSIDFC